MGTRPALVERADRHAALGDPTRLAIVDELIASDRSPVELHETTGVPSNLLAHHLDVLERVGLITRTRSSGDRRRCYIHLDVPALDELAVRRRCEPQAALFVCTHNSARSQLAAVLWRRLADAPAESAGTRPAERVHPKAVAAARRAGLDLSHARPRPLEAVRSRPALVVTVCDRAREELDVDPTWLHWSVPDPVPAGTRAAFDQTTADLRARIGVLLGRMT